MIKLLAALGGLITLLNNLWTIYQREVEKETVREAVKKETEKVTEKVKANATKVREAVNRADARAVDDGLSKYYRD